MVQMVESKAGTWSDKLDFIKFLMFENRQHQENEQTSHKVGKKMLAKLC